MLRRSHEWCALVVVAASACGLAAAHEVSIHQRMSQKAAANARFFARFLADSGLTDVPLVTRGDMRRRIQSAYRPVGGSAVIEENNDFLAGAVGDAPDVIRLGSILEDGGARTCNHFFTPTDSTTGIRLTGGGSAALCEAQSLVGDYTDARTWALESAGNTFGWNAALESYWGWLTLPDREARESALVDMLIALGQVIHLLQDLSAPDHTRNDDHLCVHIFGIDGPRCSSFHAWGHRYHRLFDVFATGVGETDESTAPTAAFASMAGFSSPNFFSDHTILSPAATPWIGSQEPAWDFADGFVRNPRLNEARVAWFPPVRTIWVESPFDPGIRAPIPVFFDDLETAMKYPEYGTLTDPEGLVFVENATWLYPRAVNESIKALNFFFRGKLTLTGTSEPEGGQHRLHLTLKNDGAGAIYIKEWPVWKWEDTDGNYHDLEVELETAGGVTLEPGATVQGEALYPDSDPKAPKDVAKIVVAYWGPLGGEDGIVGTNASIPLAVAEPQPSWNLKWFVHAENWDTDPHQNFFCDEILAEWETGDVPLHVSVETWEGVPITINADEGALTIDAELTMPCRATGDYSSFDSCYSCDYSHSRVGGSLGGAYDAIYLEARMIPQVREATSIEELEDLSRYPPEAHVNVVGEAYGDASLDIFWPFHPCGTTNPCSSETGHRTSSQVGYVAAAWNFSTTEMAQCDCSYWGLSPCSGSGRVVQVSVNVGASVGCPCETRPSEVGLCESCRDLPVGQQHSCLMRPWQGGAHVTMTVVR